MLHIKQNLALIGLEVSEEMMLEYYGDTHVYCPRVVAHEWTTTDDVQTDAGAWVYYKLTCEPSAQVS